MPHAHMCALLFTYQCRKLVIWNLHKFSLWILCRSLSIWVEKNTVTCWLKVRIELKLALFFLKQVLSNSRRNVEAMSYSVNETDTWLLHVSFNLFCKKIHATDQISHAWVTSFYSKIKNLWKLIKYQGSKTRCLFGQALKQKKHRALKTTQNPN